jgi:hypothetical protein
MQIKYSKYFLNKLEDIFAESDYILRYEKGNFKSGYCIINESKVAIVNKFYPLEGKINCLLEILKQVSIDLSKLSNSNQKFFKELFQTELNF